MSLDTNWQTSGFQERRYERKLFKSVPGHKLANTWFSRIIYKNFHHEDFDEYGGWHLKKNGGRLSNANQAIPYIIFERDLKIFKEKFPGFNLIKKYKFKPVHYVLSGGFSYKPIFNSQLFLKIIRIIEFILYFWDNQKIAVYIYIPIRQPYG